MLTAVVYGYIIFAYNTLGGVVVIIAFVYFVFLCWAVNGLQHSCWHMV